MRCIKKTVQLNQPCELNEQCVRFDRRAFCDLGGVCGCLQNFTQHDNTCRSLVKIGEVCESTEECRKFTANATCLDHRCACDENFVSSDDGNVRMDQFSMNDHKSICDFSCACLTRSIRSPASKTSNVSLDLDRDPAATAEFVFAMQFIEASPTTSESFASVGFCMVTHARSIQIAKLISAKRQ